MESRRPSDVFVQRLRETRNARALSQAEFAELLKAHGVPLSKTALARIESGDRGLSLDEALAISATLNAVPGYMLTPNEGEYVRLTDKYAADGSGVREFLQQGFPWNLDPVPEEAREDAGRDRFILRLAALARSLDDAVRVVKDPAAVRAAGEAIVTEVKRRENEKGETA